MPGNVRTPRALAVGVCQLEQPFTNKSILVGDTYNIEYYCNKDGDRQIYSFIDITPPPKDYAKCVNINGTCQ